ncbi:hypothetical protein, partial [Paraburkholderia sp. RL17-373-BIF-A]|uniref:hypothetical protein n=1 Tax=Paraburkholderia sp. RL17-373-BIF-A TaxID=3031629 RepID=UPI0038BB7D69
LSLKHPHEDFRTRGLGLLELGRGRLEGLTIFQFRMILAGQIRVQNLLSPSEVIGEVNDAISRNLVDLQSPTGMHTASGGTVRLDDGRDLVSFQMFDNDAKTEWCLLRRHDKVFDLITWDTAIDLMNKCDRIHPL